MFPVEFEKRMKKMLGDEYEQFVLGFEGERYHALRVNPLKATVKEVEDKLQMEFSAVPWEENGLYYKKEETPGKHPFHDAGVYYIQEPSAMAPVHYLDVRPGEKVLDLCAAPGGKSTQIAGRLMGEGILVCNEIHPARAKILSENVERLGISNAIVCNETPQRLAEHFCGYFDKILVDAPCSGEGMFRKNEIALSEWSEDNVVHCATRQDDILDEAAAMLKRGGRLVYSTCTFAPKENEGSVSRFLDRHPEFSVVKVDKYDGMSSGCGEWIEAPAPHIEDTIRLFPHKIRGEGHYLAVLQKEGSTADGGYVKGGLEMGIHPKDIGEFIKFQQQTLCRTQFYKEDGVKILFGEQLYELPPNAPSLKGLKVLRPGLHLGTMKKNRFEPAHALALFLKPEDVRHSICYGQDSQEVISYLKGQTENIEGEKGWYLVCVEGYSLGWAKLAGNVLKNHYPKGLRRM